MKNALIRNLGIVLLSVVQVSCEESKEETACRVAEEFAEAFYNLDVKKARGYCHRDLYPIMDFRYANLRPSDRAFLEASGKVDVRVIDSEFDPEGFVNVDVEVSNVLKIDYMTDSLSILPRDTVSLIITTYNHKDWYVTEIFKKY